MEHNEKTFQAQEEQHAEAVKQLGVNHDDAISALKEEHEASIEAEVTKRVGERTAITKEVVAMGMTQEMSQDKILSMMDSDTLNDAKAFAMDNMSTPGAFQSAQTNGVEEKKGKLLAYAKDRKGSMK